MKALTFEIVSLCRSSAANRIFSLLQQARGPGMRHVGQNLDARVTGRRNAGDRIFDRMAQIGIGAEGEFHRRRPVETAGNQSRLLYSGVRRSEMSGCEIASFEKPPYQRPVQDLARNEVRTQMPTRSVLANASG